MTNKLFQTMYAGLVKCCGGADAVAALMEIETGVGHKGTISKMCNGVSAVTVEAMMIAQRGSGLNTFTNYLADIVDGDNVTAKDMTTLSAEAAKESGEAQYAITMPFSALSKDPTKFTPEEIAIAIIETQQARDTFNELYVKLKGMQRDA